MLERTFFPAIPPTAPGRRAATSVHLDRLVPAITDPVNHLNSLYGWGTPTFDAGRLLGVLESALAALGSPCCSCRAPGPPAVAAVLRVRPRAHPRRPGPRPPRRAARRRRRRVDFPLSPPTWSAQVALTGKLPADTGGDIRPPLDITCARRPESRPASPSASRPNRRSPSCSSGPPGDASGVRVRPADAGVVTTFDTARARHGGPTLDGEIRGGKLVDRRLGRRRLHRDAAQRRPHRDGVRRRLLVRARDGPAVPRLPAPSRSRSRCT